jgi:hypothetical protein
MLSHAPTSGNRPARLSPVASAQSVVGGTGRAVPSTSTIIAIDLLGSPLTLCGGPRLSLRRYPEAN